MRSRSARLALLAAAAASSLGLASSAHAATYPVTTMTDGGPGSLRQAIIDANAHAGADTITIAAAATGESYARTITGNDSAGATPASTGDLDISGDLTIAGPAPTEGKAIINAGPPFGSSAGSPTDRVFEITGGAKVTMSGVSITGGKVPVGAASSGGGGVKITNGELTLKDSFVLQNTASSGAGGGILLVDGKLAATDSYFGYNTSEAAAGGGIAHPAGGAAPTSITLTDTAFNQNHADTQTGGAVADLGAGTLSVTRAFFTGNTANDGGGINAGGDVTKIVDTYLASNKAHANSTSSQGGGILVSGGGTLELDRTLLTANQAGVGAGISQPAGGGPLTILNSTFSANAAQASAGAIRTAGDGASVTNSTFADNTAPSGSALVAGAAALNDPITLINSIVSGDAQNCAAGKVVSGGHNLDSGTSCPFTQAGDLRSTDAKLGPLESFEQNDHHHPLLAGSPAIDAADSAHCPAIDSRRFPRVASACDMGAYEAGAAVVPNTTITSGPDGPTGSASPSFEFTSAPSAGATFKCWLDSAAPADCVSPKDLTGLADGPHTFHVEATASGAADPTPAARAFFVDTQAPTASVAAVASPPFGYAAVDGIVGTAALTSGGTDPAPSPGSVTTRCVLDPPSAPANYDAIAASPGCPATLILTGVHKAYAASIDAAGNTSAVAATNFTILAAPDTKITEAPTRPLNHAPSFEFTANSPSATFECAVDGNAFRDCVSPFTLELPSDGKYLFRVRAKIREIRDPVSATADFVIDTLAPTTLVGVEAATDGQEVGKDRFAVAVNLHRSISDPEPSGGGGGELRCVLDPPTPPAAFADIPASPGCPLRFTDVGTHTFYAATVDGAGNIGPVASATFTIVNSPDTTITGQPTNPTAAAPTFRFVSTIPGSTFECQVDRGAFSPCGSPSTLYSLARGSHFFGVRAISPDGIVDASPASTLVTLAIEEHRDSCGLDPGDTGAGCYLLADVDGFLKDVINNKLFPILCPAGSKCTLSGRIDIDDVRPGGSTAGYLSLHLSDYDERNSLRRVQFTHVECDTRAGSPSALYPKPCPQTDSVSIAGPAYAAGGCWRDETNFGDSTLHRQNCSVKLTIEPLAPLDVVTGGGNNVSVVLPAPGTLVVGESSSGSSKAMQAVAARAAKPKKKAKKKPLFTAGSFKVTQAGPVTVPLKLSAAAKKTLKKKGLLTMSITSGFTPQAGGATTVKITKVTLRRSGTVCKPSANLKKVPKCN